MLGKFDFERARTIEKRKQILVAMRNRFDVLYPIQSTFRETGEDDGSGLLAQFPQPPATGLPLKPAKVRVNLRNPNQHVFFMRKDNSWIRERTTFCRRC